MTATLQKDSYAFVIYNAGNKRGSTEDYDGKGCAINVDGTDVVLRKLPRIHRYYLPSSTLSFSISQTLENFDLQKFR